MFGKKPAGPPAFGSNSGGGMAPSASPAPKKKPGFGKSASAPMGGGRETWNHKKDPHKV